MTITGVVDIALVATVIYALLAWFKKTKAAFVAMGMIMLALVYMVARVLHLTITVWLFQGFFAISMIAVVVLFQEELRCFFERIAISSLRRSRADRPSPSVVEIIVGSVTELARNKTGALIVMHGRDPLHRHVEAGWELHGEVSPPLLESIFDTHSSGHDGAVIIENGRLARFGCHLPLSKVLSQRSELGTRHTAAIGLSERTDALCIVVSEERGTISVTRAGRLELAHDSSALKRCIEAFVDEVSPRSAKQSAMELVTHNLREKATALAVSTVMWCLFAGIGAG